MGPNNCVVIIELSIQQGNTLKIKIASLDNQFTTKKTKAAMFSSDSELKSLIEQIITRNHVYHEGISIETVYRCLDTNVFNKCVNFLNDSTLVTQVDTFNRYHKVYKWNDYGASSNNTIIINRAEL